MSDNVYRDLAIMCATVYAIRLLPFLFIRKEIKNSFIRSFLHYVPYVTLAVMTFPAIISATNNPVSGFIALIVGLVVAWFGGNLVVVAGCCCLAVLLTGLF